MEIVWTGNNPKPEFDDRVRTEIEGLLADGLGRTDDLITHLIALGDLEDGPLIEAHGRDGKIYATYIEKPIWVTAADLS